MPLIAVVQDTTLLGLVSQKKGNLSLPRKM